MSEYDFGPQPRFDRASSSTNDAYNVPLPSQSRVPSSQRGMGLMGFEDFNSDPASFDFYDDALWDDLEEKEPPPMTREERERLENDPEAVARRVAELDRKNAEEWQRESVRAGAPEEELQAIPGMSMRDMQKTLQQADSQAEMKSAIVYLNLRQGEEFEGVEIIMVPGDPEQDPIYQFVDTRELDDLLQEINNPSEELDTLLKNLLEELNELPQEWNTWQKMMMLLRRKTLLSHRGKARFKQYQIVASKFYDVTIGKIYNDLQNLGINHLQMVVDDEFQYIPFSALRNQENQYLIEEFSLAFSLSFQMTEFEHHDLREASVTALGESDFEQYENLAAASAENELVNTINKDGNNPEVLGSEPIPEERRFTRENLQQYLQENAGSAVNEVWKNAANIDNLLEAFQIARLEGYIGLRDLLETKYGIEEVIQILHITTHGEFRRNPEEQYLAMRTENLTLAEILSYDFEGLELVFFGACRTSVGNDENEHGIAGAVLNRGAESVVGSLWLVSDEGTFAMVKAFYEILEQEGLSKAQLLQKAQIAMLEGWIRFEDGYLVYEPNGQAENAIKIKNPRGVIPRSNLDKPYYWSAFQMYGSGH